MKLKLWPGVLSLALALLLAMPAAARVLKINELCRCCCPWCTRSGSIRCISA